MNQQPDVPIRWGDDTSHRVNRPVTSPTDYDVTPTQPEMRWQTPITRRWPNGAISRQFNCHRDVKDPNHPVTPPVMTVTSWINAYVKMWWQPTMQQMEGLDQSHSDVTKDLWRHNSRTLDVMTAHDASDGRTRPYFRWRHNKPTQANVNTRKEKSRKNLRCTYVSLVSNHGKNKSLGPV